MARLKVAFTGEGTYPYVTGGVSTWADILINKMKDIDFILIPILMTPYIKIKYQLPANVTRMIKVPLWGSEEPSEFVHSDKFSEIYIRKLKTLRKKNAINNIVELITGVLDFIYKKNENYQQLGEMMLKFYDFFQEYDYHEAFRSDIVWKAYVKKMEEIYKERHVDIPSIYDMIESLRFLFRFFIVLLAPVPEANIYHSSAAAFCGLPCIIAKLKYGSKFILTEHGIYTREQYLYASREGIAYRTKEFLLGLIGAIVKINYYFSDVIAPVCNYNKRWELKWGATEEKIKTIYNGIDVLKFKNIDIEKKESRPTVVMVARIDPLKDIETFILTCNLVRKEIPDVLFKLYGPYVDEKYYKKCQDLHNKFKLENNFIFAGPTDRPEIAYNEGDVVVLTSISEAFPFTVIEAMSCEKVVVSSDVGGTKEVLEGFGFIVKPKDYESFAKHIIWTLKNSEEAKQMGIAARERILLGFTLEDMVENYSNLYFTSAGVERT